MTNALSEVKLLPSASKIDPILEEGNELTNTGKNSCKNTMNFNLDLENTTGFSLLRARESSGQKENISDFVIDDQNDAKF